MRISDWSSDVCSSDLDILTNFAEAQRNPCHCREELAAPAGRRHAKRLLPRFETLAFILVSRLPIEHASTARRRSLLCQSNVRECEKRANQKQQVETNSFHEAHITSRICGRRRAIARSALAF